MKFILDDQQLTLKLERGEKAWALKKSITVNASDIINVEWVASTVNTWRLNGLRAPGTSLPGIFYAGSFYRKSGWEFWYLKVKKPGHIIITTSLKKYRVLRVSVSESEALRISEWFNNYKNQGSIA